MSSASDHGESTNVADATAACCAHFYEQDWVQQIMGDSFHPGGANLSSRLVGSLGLAAGSRVLDVACGIGTTSRLMRREFDYDVTGLDFSDRNIDRAKSLTHQEGLERCAYVRGSADRLPFDDDSFDAVVCECAVSTFENQTQVIDEFRRVLRPGGVLGISDMVVNGVLPTHISAQVAPWTCMAKAESVAGYQRMFLDAGFVVAHYADESSSLLELSLDLKRKLLMLGVGKATGLAEGIGLDIAEMRKLLGESQQLVREGTVGYCRMVFQIEGGSLTNNQQSSESSASTVNANSTGSNSLPINDCGCGPEGCC